MSRRLDDLTPEFRSLAVELLARLVEANIPVMIIDTLRTQEEQAENLRKGVSWTKNSLHLTGQAIDICPWEVWQKDGPDKLNWDGNDPIWTRIGTIGERIGLEWGGRWEKRDMGHFQLKKPQVRTGII